MIKYVKFSPDVLLDSNRTRHITQLLQLTELLLFCATFLKSEFFQADSVTEVARVSNILRIEKSIELQHRTGKSTQAKLTRTSYLY